MSEHEPAALSHDEIEDAVVYFMRLAVEALLGISEVSHSLKTTATLHAVVQKLLKHRSRRAGVQRTARRVDLFESLLGLIDEPIPDEIKVEKIQVWARRRAIPLTRDQAQAILSGPFLEGAKVGGPRERLQARLAKVLGVGQSTLDKIHRATTEPIPDDLAIKSPEEFTRALDDASVPAPWLLYYVLVALRATPEQSHRVLAIFGVDSADVQGAFAEISVANFPDVKTGLPAAEAPPAGAAPNEPASKPRVP